MIQTCNWCGEQPAIAYCPCGLPVCADCTADHKCPVPDPTALSADLAQATIAASEN